MKRILLALLAVGMVSGISMAATDTMNFPITVQIGYAIDLVATNAEVNWGSVQPGAASFSQLASGQPRSTVDQMGYATIHYHVTAGVASAVTWTANAWTLVSTVPAVANEARLSGVFTAPLTVADAPANPDFAHDLVVGDFAADDVITGTLNSASATNLCRTGELMQFRGYNVSSSNASRSLRYMLDAPITGSYDNQQRITVTIVGVTPGI